MRFLITIAASIVIISASLSQIASAAPSSACAPSRASLCVLLHSGRSVSVTYKDPGPDFPLQGEVTGVHRGKVDLRASTFSAKPVVVAFSSALGNQAALIPGHRVSFDFHPAREGSPASVRVNDLEAPSDEGAVSGSEPNPVHAAPTHVAAHTAARRLASRPHRAAAAAPAEQAPPAQQALGQPADAQADQPQPPSEIQQMIAASPWCDSLAEGSSAAPYTGKTCKVRDRRSGMALLAWVADQDLERKEKHLPRLLCATPPSMQGRRRLPASMPCSEIKDDSSSTFSGGR